MVLRDAEIGSGDISHGIESHRGIEVQQHGIQPIRQSSFVACLELTGSGYSYANCGHFFTVGCLDVENHRGMNLDGVNMENKVFLRRRKISCFRPLCPVCWGDWANREAKRAVQRLGAYQLRDSRNHSQKPIHVIVSVPHSDYGLSLQAMRRKVYDALKRVHCLGGMLIYHPKRQNESTFEWYFSPHFHMVGYGWITDVRANYIYSGYVVKNVGIRKTLHGTIYYQLSHCGIDEKFHTVTWFGKLSYGKLHVEYVVEEKEVCLLCGGSLHELLWIGPGECALPDVEGISFYDEFANWCIKPKLRWSD